MGRTNAEIVDDTLEEDAQSIRTNDERDSEEQNTVYFFNCKRAEARRDKKCCLLEMNDMSHRVRWISDAVTTLVESITSDGDAGPGERDLDARVKKH